MNLPLSPRIRSLLPRGTALLACCAILASFSPARADLGGLMKKAKKSVESAVKKTDPAAAPADAGKVEFDDVILELNSERVGHILAAYAAAKAAGAGRPALVEKLNKANEDRGALMDKEGEKIQATRNKRSDVEACRYEGYQEAQDRRLEEYKARALTDPALLQKFQRAAAENNAAAAKGDSAAMQRIMQVLHEETAPTREDTLKVQQKCGTLPPKSAAEEKLESFDKQIASYEEQIRQIDEKVADAQDKEGGMDRQQWAMAVERITMYLSNVKNHGSDSGGKGGSKSGSKSGSGSASGGGSGSGYKSDRSFSAVEYEALEKRLEELRAAFGV